MQRRPLGRTDLKVSSLCLGTMTWGEQNTEADAYAQLDQAQAAGINFLDTAEMYPVPPRPDTSGRTECYIGNYFRNRGNRADWIIASKIAGPGNGISHIRDGHLKFNRDHIRTALDNSLRRLRTDWIDLYQLHWPERNTNFFGQLGYQHQESDFTPLEEVLDALDQEVKAGRIRHVGLSNETPWGAMKYLQLAEARGLPRAVSIQNPYNLLNRSYEIGLAEISIREHCGLLAYSPLAFGMLSGKYELGAQPADARITRFQRFARYSNPQARTACSKYVALAREYGLDPAQMALAFVTAQPFVTSNIIGATSLEQLDSNLRSSTIRLPDEVIERIEAIHVEQPNPAP